MEELLASIRKAIQDDVGEIPSVPAVRPYAAPAQRSASVYGSMRESKVRVSDEPPPTTSAEINGLRDRIQRNRAAEALARDIGNLVPAQRGAAQAGRSGPSSAVPSAQPDGSWRPPTAELPAPYEPQRHESQRLEPPRAAPPLRPSYAAEIEASVAEPYGRAGSHGRFSREVEALQHQPGYHEPQQLPHYQAQPALPPPSPVAHHAPASESPILSDDASHTASAAFNRLADSFLARALGERPIEDMARDMLRGMLKQWLDDNLPALVERLVREEIERIARRGR